MSEKPAKRQCEKKVYANSSDKVGRQCTNSAREGKQYCGNHLPKPVVVLQPQMQVEEPTIESTQQVELCLKWETDKGPMAQANWSYPRQMVQWTVLRATLSVPSTDEMLKTVWFRGGGWKIGRKGKPLLGRYDGHAPFADFSPEMQEYLLLQMRSALFL